MVEENFYEVVLIHELVHYLQYHSGYYDVVECKQQLESDDSIELRLKDKSKLDNKTPFTSDQALYEISNIKEDINKSILKSVKEASIDCILHMKDDNKENLKCFSFLISCPV